MMDGANAQFAEQRIYAKIRQYLHDGMDWDVFYLWLSDEMWHGPDADIGLDALLWMYEGRGEEEVRTLLAGRLYLYEMRRPPVTGVALSSTSFTVYGTQTFTIGGE